MCVRTWAIDNRLDCHIGNTLLCIITLILILFAITQSVFYYQFNYRPLISAPLCAAVRLALYLLFSPSSSCLVFSLLIRQPHPQYVSIQMTRRPFSPSAGHLREKLLLSFLLSIVQTCAACRPYQLSIYFHGPLQPSSEGLIEI